MLHDVSLEIPEKRITAIVGPAGSGKSALLRTLNRMNDTIPNHRMEGDVLLDGENIYSNDFDPIELRRWVGMVFWRSRMYENNIFDEMARRLKNEGLKKNSDIKARAEKSLRDAMLRDEVKDKLTEDPQALSELQWRKLAIAKTIAHDPEVVLLDEPLRTLESNDIREMNDLILSLKERFTLVMATSSEESAKIADFTALLQ